MLVHSLWDQEDIYGNIALYKALKAQQADTSNLFLVIGPWFHHQQRLDGSAIGDIRFGSDTAAYFRLHVLRPFLDHYLKDDAPPLGDRAGDGLRDRHQSLAVDCRPGRAAAPPDAASTIRSSTCSRAAACAWAPRR